MESNKQFHRLMINEIDSFIIKYNADNEYNNSLFKEIQKYNWNNENKNIIKYISLINCRTMKR